MISISYLSDIEKLSVRIGGDNFRELVDFMKENNGIWNPGHKTWTIDMALYDTFIEEANAFGETVDVDFIAKAMHEKFIKSLNELKVLKTRRVFKSDLLKYPPLKGIPPNENYQTQDILRALLQNRFLFNYEMGLGKSYILIALIENLRYYKEINKSLVFSTPIGVLNLKQELLKFSTTLKDEDIITFASGATFKYEDRDIFNTKKYPQKILILTYDMLKSVSNYYYDQGHGTKAKPHPGNTVKYQKHCMPIDEWLGNENGGLFLDECHSLANPGSRRTKIMNMILPHFSHRYLFTGTLADTYEKLYEPCLILSKSLVQGKSYQTWLQDYNEVGNRWSKFAVNPNRWKMDNIGELNKVIMKKYGSKKKMVECLNLPPNIEVPTLWIDMSKTQRAIYEYFSVYLLNKLKADAERDGTTMAHKSQTLFPFVQLSVDNPSCLLSSEKFIEFPEELQTMIKKFDYNKDFNKLDLIDEIIQDNSGDLGYKGILWYIHPATEKELLKRYEKYNPVAITAEIPRDERFKLIDEFLHNPKEKLIIASISVMNTSVTLVECKYEVYVEKTFNYTDYKQSRGRIWRPGQKDITKTYSIRYNNSIDNLQEMALATKGEVINSLLNKDYISHDIWKKLFNLQRGDEL